MLSQQNGESSASAFFVHAATCWQCNCFIHKNKILVIRKRQFWHLKSHSLWVRTWLTCKLARCNTQMVWRAIKNLQGAIVRFQSNILDQLRSKEWQHGGGASIGADANILLARRSNIQRDSDSTRLCFKCIYRCICQKCSIFCQSVYRMRYLISTSLYSLQEDIPIRLGPFSANYLRRNCIFWYLLSRFVLHSL